MSLSFPSPSIAGRQAGELPRRAVEVVLPLASCSTQERDPKLPLGDTVEPAMDVRERELGLPLAWAIWESRA